MTSIPAMRRLLLVALLLAGCTASAGEPSATTEVRSLCAHPPSDYPVPIDLHPEWVDATGLELSPITGERNATEIAGQAIAHWEAGEPDALLARAEWLAANMEPDGRFLYHDDFGGQPNPWWSALPQGLALSVFVRAYDATREPRWLDAADRALLPFTRLQADGGVLSSGGGYTWIEEYMPPYAPHVLNGAIWATFGLIDYQACRGDAASRAAIDTEVATLHANLVRYEWEGGWSYYDLRGTNLAHSYYHRLHVLLLCGLGRVAGDVLFTETARRWSEFTIPAAVAEFEQATSGTPPEQARQSATC